MENIDTLIHDLKECKNSLEQLLLRIGHAISQPSDPQLDWPHILINLRIVSTNLILITKYIKEKRDPLLKSSVIVPKYFSEDVDNSIKVGKINLIL